jgi:hypothetical protein
MQGALYHAGRLHSVEPVSVDRLFVACQSALAELDMPVKKKVADDRVADLHSETFDGNRVTLRLEYEREVSTALSIHVAVPGDLPRSEHLLKTIRKNY